MKEIVKKRDEKRTLNKDKIRTRPRKQEQIKEEKKLSLFFLVNRERSL